MNNFTRMYVIRSEILKSLKFKIKFIKVYILCTVYIRVDNSLVTWYNIVQLKKYILFNKLMVLIVY